jgi:hypothetical protein
MDVLRLFGLFAVALCSIYDFLQGDWPFGLVEAVWAGVALWRWSRQAAPECIAWQGHVVTPASSHERRQTFRD